LTARPIQATAASAGYSTWFIRSPRCVRPAGQEFAEFDGVRASSLTCSA